MHPVNAKALTGRQGAATVLIPSYGRNFRIVAGRFRLNPGSVAAERAHGHLHGGGGYPSIMNARECPGKPDLSKAEGAPKREGEAGNVGTISELWLVVPLLLLACAALAGSFTFTPSALTGPRTVPMLASAMIVAIALALVIEVALGRRPHVRISLPLLRLVAIALSLLLYALFLVPHLSFIPATVVLLLLLYTFAVQRPAPRRMLVQGMAVLLVTLAIYGIFTQLLHVSLP